MSPLRDGVDPLPPLFLDDRRHECRCKPWAQSWRPESPERCVTCGGMFPAHTVDARRPMPGDPQPEQEAICTQTDDCKALADAHQDDCPVELKLRDELGF